MRRSSAREVTAWEAFGGTETFDRLVRRFYDGVRNDEVLAPMYPDDDWDGAIWRLRTFLEQYWGGPTTYSEQRGHPRLRMRHAPYTITPEARDRWLQHMRTAVAELDLAEDLHQLLWQYLERAAFSLVNTMEAP